MAKMPNIKKKIALGVFAAMLAVGLGIASLDAAPVDDEVCFELLEGINNPSEAEASNPGNFIVPENGCPGDEETLCKICFDEEKFPLNALGKPDFVNYPELKALVINNMNTLVDGTYTDGSGNWVKLTFRGAN